MKLFQKKPKDERVVAETNRVYKIGFFIMDIGILLDLYLQFASGAGEGFPARPVEFGVLMLANIMCMILMARKGLADDNRYAEADVFPKKYYALTSLAAGAGAALLFSVLRMLTSPYWEFGVKSLILAKVILFFSMTLTIAIAIYALQYFVFRMAKRRRDQMNSEDDEMKM